MSIERGGGDQKRRRHFRYLFEMSEGARALSCSPRLSPTAMPRGGIMFDFCHFSNISRARPRGKRSRASGLYFHVNIARIGAAGYFKLIFEINTSSGVVAHPSELALLPFNFGILFAFNVHGFGSEPSDTIAKRSRNIIM